MFGRKYINHDTSTQKRLQKLEEICNNPGQDQNIATLCRSFLRLKEKKQDDQVLTEIEEAISKAIPELSSGPFLDVSQLSQALKEILCKNQYSESTQHFLENVSTQLDVIVITSSYHAYSEEKLNKLVASMTERIESHVDLNGFAAEFLVCYKSLVEQGLITHSLVIRKLMLSIGQEINNTLKVVARPIHAPFLNYYRSTLADCLCKILDEYQTACLFEERHRLQRRFELAQESTDRYSICLEIMKRFIENHPLTTDESSLKRVSHYFVKHYQEKSNHTESDQRQLENIAEVIAECVVRYSTNDKLYFPGLTLLHALKNINPLHEDSAIMKNLMSGSLYLPVSDPFDYKDYFSGEYPHNQGMQTLYTFRTDLDRFPPATVIAGQLLGQEIKRYSEAEYSNLVKSNLFNDVHDQDMQSALVDLFRRHAHQAGLSHLSMSLFSTYLSVQDALCEIIAWIVPNDVRISFYPIKNGYGIVQKNPLIYCQPPERAVLFPFGTIAITHELTLNSANPDDVTVRCVGLEYQRDKSQVDISMTTAADQLIAGFVEIIEQKICCIPNWQLVDTGVMLFAYGLAIEKSKDIIGFQLQALAKDFCAIVRENYSAPMPNTTIVDEMNELCGVINTIIKCYQDNTQDLVFQVLNLERQLQEFARKLGVDSDSMFSSSNYTLYNRGSETCQFPDLHVGIDV